MTHPDHVVPLEELESILRVEPVYGLTGGLTQRPLQKAIAAAVERAPELPEWQDAAYLKKQKWSGWKAALATAHAPADEADLSPMHPARARLAFDELLASQLAIALVRHHNRTLRRPGDQGRRRPAEARAGGPALPAHAEPDLRLGGDRGRHGQARAHGAAAAGRCRQRQDAGRLPRHADRRRGRRAGRAHGADRAAGAPALRHHRAARRGGRRQARAADRPRRLAPEEGDAAGPRRRHDPARGRHARAGAGRRRVRRSRAGRGRRAAPLRRAPAHGAVVEEPCGRPAGDDRHADPAHPDAGRLRRPRRLQAHREAGRPPADRHPHAPARAHRRSGRRRGPHGRHRRAGLLGLPADRGVRGRRPRQRRGAPSPAERALPRQGRAGAWPAEERRARGDHGGLRRRASCRSWWRPRSSRSASTCRPPP